MKSEREDFYGRLNKMRRASRVDELKPKLQKQYSPLNKKGNGNQGYLYHLTKDAGEYLLSAIKKINQ